MAKIFAELADEHPYEESVQGKVSLVGRPGLACLVEQPHKSSVANKCWRRQGGEVHRIGRVWLSAIIDRHN